MRVFSVPASAPFLRTVIAALVDGRLVDGFEARAHPERLAQATLYLPTRRAGRMVREIFLDELEHRRRAAAAHRRARRHRRGRAGIRGRAESYGGTASLDIPPKLGELERRLTLASLVAAWAKEPGAPAPLVVGGPASTLALAGDLARLMDDMVTRGVGWDALDGLVPDQLDEYWQYSLEFLQIARQAWPAHLAGNRQDRAGGAARSPDRGGSQAPGRASRRSGDRGGFDRIDAGDREIPARHRALFRKARWFCRGSIPISTTTPGRSSAASATRKANSRRRRRRTIRNMRCTRCCIGSGSSAATSKSWAKPAPHGRDVLVSEAMRPSNATAQWQRRLAEPDIAEKIALGMTNLAVIEADNPEMEALAIAVAMREARHLNKSAALVTPDRALARRVIAALGRWNLAFDDSGGDALMDTPAGIFARLAAEAAARQLEPPTLLALLKHPLCRLGAAQGAFKDADRGARTGAAARHAAAGGKQRTGAGFRALSRRAGKICGAARRPRCTAPNRGPRLSDDELDDAHAADRPVAERAGAARKPRSVKAPSISPNSRNAIATC